MQYFKDKNNEIFAYDDEQVQQGFGKDLISITQAELDAINEAKRLEVEELPETKIAEAKQYLANTDWIVIKINEVQIEGGDVASLMTQYSTELQKRKDSRETINSLEA